MRKTTNSAGLTSASPTSQTSLPASRSPCVIVDRSQRIAYNFRVRIAQFRGQDPEAIRPQRAGEE